MLITLLNILPVVSVCDNPISTVSTFTDDGANNYYDVERVQ